MDIVIIPFTGFFFFFFFLPKKKGWKIFTLRSLIPSNKLYAAMILSLKKKEKKMVLSSSEGETKIQTWVTLGLIILFYLSEFHFWRFQMKIGLYLLTTCLNGRVLFGTKIQILNTYVLFLWIEKIEEGRYWLIYPSQF